MLLRILRFIRNFIRIKKNNRIKSYPITKSVPKERWPLHWIPPVHLRLDKYEYK